MELSSLLGVLQYSKVLTSSNKITPVLILHHNITVVYTVDNYDPFWKRSLSQKFQLFVFHRKVLEQRDSVYEKISQYLQLRSIIQSLQVLLCTFFFSF